jgi:hypothetical protein
MSSIDRRYLSIATGADTGNTTSLTVMVGAQGIEPYLMKVEPRMEFQRYERKKQQGQVSGDPCCGKLVIWKVRRNLFPLSVKIAHGGWGDPMGVKRLGGSSGFWLSTVVVG